MPNFRNSHWLRFSLRTMFVAITAAAVWLGWSARLVSQRESFAESLRLNRRGYASEFAVDGSGQFHGPGGSRLFTWAAGSPDVTVASLQFMVGATNVFAPTASKPAWIRILMGDRAYASVVLNDPHDVHVARRLFPEAIVLTLPKNEHVPQRRREVTAAPNAEAERSILVRRTN